MRRGNIPVWDTVNNNDKEGPEDQKRIRFWGTLRRNLLKSDNGGPLTRSRLEFLYFVAFSNQILVKHVISSHRDN